MSENKLPPQFKCDFSLKIFFLQICPGIPGPGEPRAAAHRDPLQRRGGQVRDHDRPRQDPAGDQE